MTILPVSMAEMKEKNETFFIELYILELRTGTTYIAACDEDIEFAGNRYIAVPFERENVVRSMDNITDSVSVTFGDCDEGLLAFILNGFDFRGVTATILRIQYPDSLSDPRIFQWMFTGFIDEPSFSGGTFSCRIVSRFPEINCPNRRYQLACNNTFGDSCCGVDLAIEEKTITGMDGNKLSFSTTWPEDYWKDGVATINGESRIIIRSSGNSITLNVNFVQNDIVGQKATLQRGCDKTTTGCDRFGNRKRYSGFLAIPFETVYR